MRHSFGIFLCAFFCFLATPSYLRAWPATVMNVYDGDTLTVAPAGDENNPLFVRLYGVDAPDLQQTGGQEARQWLVKTLPDRSSIEVIPMGIDVYGRVTGLVVRNGTAVNRSLLDEGHAWVSQRTCRAMVCRRWKEAEKKAHDDGKGLWAKKNPIAPWLWGKNSGMLPAVPGGISPENSEGNQPRPFGKDSGSGPQHDPRTDPSTWFLLDPP